MNRRTFLQATGSATLLALLLLKGALASEERSLVAVAEGKDYPAVTRRAIDAFGGMKRFEKAGDTVEVLKCVSAKRDTQFIDFERVVH